MYICDVIYKYLMNIIPVSFIGCIARHPTKTKTAVKNLKLKYFCHVVISRNLCTEILEIRTDDKDSVIHKGGDGRST